MFGVRVTQDFLEGVRELSKGYNIPQNWLLESGLHLKTLIEVYRETGGKLKILDVIDAGILQALDGFMRRAFDGKYIPEQQLVACGKDADAMLKLFSTWYCAVYKKKKGYKILNQDDGSIIVLKPDEKTSLDYLAEETNKIIREEKKMKY